MKRKNKVIGHLLFPLALCAMNMMNVYERIQQQQQQQTQQNKKILSQLKINKIATLLSITDWYEIISNQKKKRTHYFYVAVASFALSK